MNVLSALNTQKDSGHITGKVSDSADLCKSFRYYNLSPKFDTFVADLKDTHWKIIGFKFYFLCEGVS